MKNITITTTDGHMGKMKILSISDRKKGKEYSRLIPHVQKILNKHILSSADHDIQVRRELNTLFKTALKTNDYISVTTERAEDKEEIEEYA